MAQILIIDDEEKIRTTLRTALQKQGHAVVTAANISEGKSFLKSGYDVIILDIMLPDGNGLHLLKEIVTNDPTQAVVMISGHADISMAIEALKIGAYDFLEKPLSLDRILVTLDNALKTDSLKRERQRLTSIVYGDFIGNTPVIKQLLDDIQKSASRTTRFLISGENGTGKELVAHLIHQHSRYHEGPFVALNCAALPSELVEAELFGHTAGAFTGATKVRKGKFVEAHQGSLFLDEISEMPLDTQAKLLRAVETRSVMPVGAEKEIAVELNIIAASNKDLDQLTAEGGFRQDLLYRLNVVKLEVPPLRNRKADIPLLCNYFLDKFAQDTKSRKKQLTDDAVTFLQAFDFPGNIRELRNLMERINIYLESEQIDREQIKQFLPYIPRQNPTTLKEAVADFEKQFIEEALNISGGSVSQAATNLGLERSHLYKKMRKYGIE